MFKSPRASIKSIQNVTAACIEQLEKRQLLAGGPDRLINNNIGGTGTARFTQSETSTLAFGNNVVVAFTDLGSIDAGGHATGFAYSSDGGATFTDGGTLPFSTIGDAGDAHLVRDNTTGRIFLSTFAFSNLNAIPVFHSDDNGVTWSAPVNAAPGGGNTENTEWLAIDNFAGTGRGYLYLVSRRSSGAQGIQLYRSIDGGLTFTTAVQVIPAAGDASIINGPNIVIAPDHAVYVFWYAGATLQMKKSTNLGLTFGPVVTVASGLVGVPNEFNGGLGLTGIRQGTLAAAGFRTTEFPHVAINPVSGNLYVTYNNKGSGADKADIFLVQSIDGGASWSAPLKINDDATTTDQWSPNLAVTPDGSKIGIFYYSRQEDPASNNLFKYYGRIAGISGAALSFAPSSAISDVASLPEFGRDQGVTPVFVGKYDQASATSRGFYVSWSDNRDNLPDGAPRKDPNVYFDIIGFNVSSTVPAVGSTVTSVPLNYIVNFSEAIDASSVQAADFAINDGNGLIAANSFIVNSPAQVTFHYNSAPFAAQGLHRMEMADGAVLRSGTAEPLLPFVGLFRYDQLILQVASTSPPNPGGVMMLPSPFTLDVNFNEPIDPSTVATSDLVLSGIDGASVTDVTVLPGNITARFTLSGIGVEGTLGATIAAGNLKDPFGNPNLAFSGSYFVDNVTVPFPTPLIAEPPNGSLIYDPTTTGIISFAGDTDSFTLAVDPHQTITLLVTPIGVSLRPSVTLRDPANALLGSASAAVAGHSALLQTVATTTGGTYTFTVSGGGGSTGGYTLRVVLNAALEAEGLIAGVNNQTLAGAQNINGSFLTLSTSLSSARRGAVQGVFDRDYIESAVPFAFEDISGTGSVIAALSNEDDVNVSIPIGFNFPFFGVNNANVFVSTNGLLTFSSFTGQQFTNSDMTSNPTEASIAPFWDDLFTTSGLAGRDVFSQLLGSGADQHLTIQWNKVGFFSATASDPITFQVQLYADGRIRFNYLDLVSATFAGNNGGSATVGIKAAGTQGPQRLLLALNNGPNTFVGTGMSTLISPATVKDDLYVLTLGENESASLALKAFAAGATTTLELLAENGSVIATGVNFGTNLDRRIDNFGGAGTYYVRVSGTGGVAYSLLATKDARFETETNDTLATAQNLSERGVMGYISNHAGATNNAFFLLGLFQVGSVLRVETATPGDGAGQPSNTLNPQLILYSPTNVPIAAGSVLADGRNEFLQFTVPAGGVGVYKLAVAAESGGSGEYFLNAVVGPLPPTVIASAFAYNKPPQRVTFTFDQNVSASLLPAVDISIEDLTHHTFLSPTSYSYDTNQSSTGYNTASLNFNGVLPNANYRVTLKHAGITNAFGTAMISDYVLDFFSLAGDANHDGTVNITDLSILASNWQGAEKTFNDADFDLNGTVNIGDLAALASNWQKNNITFATPANAAPMPALNSFQPPAQPPMRPVNRVVSRILPAHAQILA